jgi:putative hydroxymethylpyrimidine transport system permease protein
MAGTYKFHEHIPPGCNKACTNTGGPRPFASGLRVATTVAPIGAVVGEWVGSSQGLGFYMLHANVRMQIDAMFAALAVLAVLALGLYFTIDKIMTKMVYWQKIEKEEE